ncbi:MAG TPA: GxxExxY protein [Patescibacteria group bacterium]|nr:GxxExxY protein [Patescibacteria group bacterium]
MKHFVDDLIEGDLSYKIIGLCMKVHSELGKSYKEKYYQKALEISFKKNSINFVREIKFDLGFEDEKIGMSYLDFLVESKIVVELKVKPFINKVDIKQVLSYLKTTDIKLGLIINFGKDSLEYKRILNSNIK